MAYRNVPEHPEIDNDSLIPPMFCEDGKLMITAVRDYITLYTVTNGGHILETAARKKDAAFECGAIITMDSEKYLIYSDATNLLRVRIDDDFANSSVQQPEPVTTQPEPAPEKSAPTAKRALAGLAALKQKNAMRKQASGKQVSEKPAEKPAEKPVEKPAEKPINEKPAEKPKPETPIAEKIDDLKKLDATGSLLGIKQYHSSRNILFLHFSNKLLVYDICAKKVMQSIGNVVKFCQILDGSLLTVDESNTLHRYVRSGSQWKQNDLDIDLPMDDVHKITDIVDFAPTLGFILVACMTDGSCGVLTVSLTVDGGVKLSDDDFYSWDTVEIETGLEHPDFRAAARENTIYVYSTSSQQVAVMEIDDGYTETNITDFTHEVIDIHYCGRNCIVTTTAAFIPLVSAAPEVADTVEMESDSLCEIEKELESFESKVSLKKDVHFFTMQCEKEIKHMRAENGKVYMFNPEIDGIKKTVELMEKIGDTFLPRYEPFQFTRSATRVPNTNRRLLNFSSGFAGL